MKTADYMPFVHFRKKKQLPLYSQLSTPKVFIPERYSSETAYKLLGNSMRTTPSFAVLCLCYVL